nr:hypothetical protein [Moraxella sp. CTOTU48717]
MQANMGMAGEFRCVVKRADGSTKIDTGYQKNLILDQGLNVFGGNTDVTSKCAIGSGNSTPIVTQTRLDYPVKTVNRAESYYSLKNDYDQTKDGNFYKTNKVVRFVFNDLNNVNISEIGLTSSEDVLFSRALIKSGNGQPTTITVLSGEILEIYYKLWMVTDLTPKTGVINVSDGVGNNTAYNYKVTPTRVAYQSAWSVYIGYSPKYVSASFYDGIPDSSPSGSTKTTNAYIDKSYKKIINFIYDVNSGNGVIDMLIATSVGCYQINFTSVADGSPITKTKTQTLTIPIELSWGRYEGAL